MSHKCDGYNISEGEEVRVKFINAKNVINEMNEINETNGINAKNPTNAINSINAKNAINTKLISRLSRPFIFHKLHIPIFSLYN